MDREPSLRYWAAQRGSAARLRRVAESRETFGEELGTLVGAGIRRGARGSGARLAVDVDREPAGRVAAAPGQRRRSRWKSSAAGFTNPGSPVKRSSLELRRAARMAERQSAGLFAGLGLSRASATSRRARVRPSAAAAFALRTRTTTRSTPPARERRRAVEVDALQSPWERRGVGDAHAASGAAGGGEHAEEERDRGEDAFVHPR